MTFGCSLFSTLQVGLKGTRFTVTEDIKSNATAELRMIPKEAFRRQDQWNKSVRARVYESD
jgi:hypothetical protein